MKGFNKGKVVPNSKVPPGFEPESPWAQGFDASQPRISKIGT